MPDLSLHRAGRRLRIYISESDRWRGLPLYEALLELLRAKGMSGATVIRGTAGFGAHSLIHTSRIEVLSIDLPVIVEIVDTPEKIAGVLDLVYPMVREGLITAEDVEIVKYTHRYLNPLPADRLVGEVMTRVVVTLQPDMSIQQAWKTMLDTTVKGMPVIDRNREVVGILTDEDLLERAGVRQRLSVAKRMDLEDVNRELHALESSPLKVADVMTWPVITTREDESLGAATARMVKEGMKRLPVVDSAGRLAGMLSRLDVLQQVAQVAGSMPQQQLRHGVVRTVGDAMSPDIPVVDVDDRLAMIVEKFAQTNSHRLIVVDSAGKPVGLLSDADVVARIQPSQRPGILNALRRIGKAAAGKETARELMSAGVNSAPPDMPVVEAVQTMLAESRKWLVVVDGEGRPLGLIDRQMLLEAVATG